MSVENDVSRLFNPCLNHAYGVIEGYVRKAINVVGLEPSVGFLLEFSRSQTKESRALDMKDFYFLGDDYRYHIEVEAKRRFLELLKNRFNSGVKYRGKIWKWDTVILNKTQELARSLLGRCRQIGFVEPRPNLQGNDTREFRRRILEVTQSEAKELRIGKSTLHYLRKKAGNDRPLKLYQKVARRLGQDPMKRT